MIITETSYIKLDTNVWIAQRGVNYLRIEYHPTTSKPTYSWVHEHNKASIFCSRFTASTCAALADGKRMRYITAN